MRRPLGSVLPALALAATLATGLTACGDDDGKSVAGDPTSTAPSPTQTPTPTPSPTESPSPTQSESPTEDPSDGQVDFKLVYLITETAAGGGTGPAVPLAGDGALQQFNGQFETDAMTHRVRDAVRQTDVPDGMLLYGAVVAVGCDAPTDVTVTADDAGVMINAVEVPNPMQECFAPMTTVALVLIPASAVS